MIDLFDPQLLGGTVQLKNRIVMAPMTRTRTSEGDVPNELMAKYYGQRASAGLIVIEATDVSPSSKGYAGTPGIYTEAQQQGWRLVTNEVHRKGGTIFVQIWHVGRMAHSSLMPNGEAPWGVTEQRAEHSDVFAHGPDGKLTYTRAGTPRRLSTDEVSALVDTFAQAFANARKAGFDGVEIHAANAYLIDQFMNSVLNSRTDRYGGERVEDRTRFLMEVVDAGVRELGPGRVSVRLCFTTREHAQAALDTGLVDLIGFGRPYIGNPDLVERLQHGFPLAEADASTYYTRCGEVGYTDFPAYSNDFALSDAS